MAMKSVLWDRVALLLSACLAAFLFFGSGIYLRTGMGVSKGWFFFLGGSVLYMGGVVYTVVSNIGAFRKNLNIRNFLKLAVIVLLFEGLFLWLFSSGILELPQHMMVYGISVLPLIVLTVKIFGYWVGHKRWSYNR
jgi:hypothetical protein